VGETSSSMMEGVGMRFDVKTVTFRLPPVECNNYTNKSTEVLNSTKLILERVKQHNHLLAWYSIVKYIDQRDKSEKNPPVFAVLKQLQDEELLNIENPNDDFPKYSITETSLDFLAKRMCKNSDS
jgi:Fe2+ or Zn2+ uptake regulation protein